MLTERTKDGQTVRSVFKCMMYSTRSFVDDRIDTTKNNNDGKQGKKRPITDAIDSKKCDTVRKLRLYSVPMNLTLVA